MKTALTTLVDDKFMPGFLITLNSLLKSSKNFKYDIIVLDWGELSDESKQIITSLYKKIIFKPILVQDYKSCKYDNTWRKWTYNCNFRFDIFLLEEYDRVVFFDCDILFQLDIDDVLKYNIDFGACPASPGQVKQIKQDVGFEGGLLTISSKYLNSKTREDLINLSLTKPPYDKNIRSRKWMSDEPILNTYFLDKLTWLPEKYNMLSDRITSSLFNTPHNYQFVGHNKPWYGTELEDQFDSHIFKSLAKLNGQFMTTILLKKIIKLYNIQVEELAQKNINILKYSGLILPIRC